MAPKQDLTKTDTQSSRWLCCTGRVSVSISTSLYIPDNRLTAVRYINIDQTRVKYLWIRFNAFAASEAFVHRPLAEDETCGLNNSI